MDGSAGNVRQITNKTAVAKVTGRADTGKHAAASGHDRHAAASGIDRRDTVRCRYDIEVGVATDHRLFIGLVSDISAGGLFVATDEPLNRGDRIDVRFSIPGSPHVFEKRATVRWLRPMDTETDSRTRAGAGLKLDDLSDDEKKILNAFLNVHEPIFFDT